MAQPNYAFAKRQRDLAKQQKKKEKALRKSGPEQAGDQPQQVAPADETATPVPPGEPNTPA